VSTANSGTIRSTIDRCLNEFDDLWDAGQNPRADCFRNRFDASNEPDFVELVYQEFCRAEADGLNPRPDEFLNHYAEFRPALEKLFAVHFGLVPDSQRPTPTEAEPATQDLPVPGDCIGPYRLMRILGQGGMGRVFLAEQTDLADRPVALKVVRIGSSIEPEHQARVNHPNVMPVFRHFRTDDGRFLAIVMPHIPGLSFDKILSLSHDKSVRKRFERSFDRLPSDSNLEIAAPIDSDATEILIDRLKMLNIGRGSRTTWNRQVAEWGVSLARALFAAYQHGIVHGDVKPGNIHVGNDLRPYLLDFHLSRRWRFERHTAVFEHDDPGGTLFYMPPERLDQLAQRLIGSGLNLSPPRLERARFAHRGDLYSLALVLLELLTGSAPAAADPLDASNLAEAARSLADKRRSPCWCQRYPGFSKLPAAWKSFLTKALQPDPALRHVDGAEFAAELERTNASMAQRSRFRKLLRSRTLRAAAVVGLTIMGIVAVWTANAESRRRSQVASLAWQSPYEFWEDPSSFQSNTPARRLSASRAELDRLSPLVLAHSPWPLDRSIVFPQLGRLDGDLWFADRVEHLSRSLAQRALRTDDANDAAAALQLLEQGTSRFRCRIWNDREQVLRNRFGMAGSDSGDQGRDEPIVSEYVELISGETQDADLESRKWRNLVETAPGSFALKWGYARFLARSGQIPATILTLRDALKIAPGHFEARRLLAQMLFRNRQFENALREIETALAQRHDDISALRIRSILRLYVGQREELLAEIERMGDILRTDDEPLPDGDPVGSKSSASEIGNRVGSTEILDTRTVERIHELFPKDREVTTLLARKYFRDKRKGEAIALMENLLRTGPRKTQDLINLAILYRNDFQTSKAIELGMEIVDREDFGEWLNSRHRLRNFFLKLLYDIESFDRSKSIIFCEKLLRISSESQGSRGLWHYQMARLVLSEQDNDGLIASIGHLKKAGRHHKVYIVEWYKNDSTFDPYRKEIDQQLNDFFLGQEINSRKHD